jgi:hypothetical protein
LRQSIGIHPSLTKYNNFYHVLHCNTPKNDPAFKGSTSIMHLGQIEATVLFIKNGMFSKLILPTPDASTEVKPNIISKAGDPTLPVSWLNNA